jgi:hypothetical protein
MELIGRSVLRIFHGPAHLHLRAYTLIRAQSIIQKLRQWVIGISNFLYLTSRRDWLTPVCISIFYKTQFSCNRQLLNLTNRRFASFFLEVKGHDLRRKQGIIKTLQKLIMCHAWNKYTRIHPNCLYPSFT